MSLEAQEPQNPALPEDEALSGTAAADPPAAPPSESSNPPETEQEQPGKAPFWQRCPVTTVFVALILLAYGLTTYKSGFQYPSQESLRWGAFIPDAIRAGEWWRYFTVALLHANPGHIGINGFMTLAFGNLLEPVLGSRRLSLLYLITLMGSGAASYLANESGIGASGIGYGLIGAYMGIMILLRRRQQPASFWREVQGLFLFVALFVASNVLDGHINVWAHLGGFFSGLAFAVILFGGCSPSRHPHP